jgi:hypothetical protein
MKLSELPFTRVRELYINLKVPNGIIRIYHATEGLYHFYCMEWDENAGLRPPHYQNLDPLTAQAVLYELTKDNAHS